MDFDIHTHTIFMTLTGSRVYGTATPESDYDCRGVAIPPARYFYGYKSHFDQFEDPNADTVVYDIRKFLKLAADNNPNVIEMLYIPQKHWTVSSPYWERLVMARDLFLSQKAYSTFRGYAYAQLKRIQTHRGWLLQGEVLKPTREQFGLPPGQAANNSQVGAALELVNRFLQQHDVELSLAEVAKLGAKAEAVDLRQHIWDFLEQTLDLVKAEIEDKVFNTAMQRIGFDTNMIDRLQREKSYLAAKRHHESWLRWKAERNEKRKAMEQTSGFDLKHSSHLARLLLMCEDILVNNTIEVECRDVQWLRDILEGRVSYDDMMTWADQQENKLEQLKATTTLRHSPDRNAIEYLGIELIQTFLETA